MLPIAGYHSRKAAPRGSLNSPSFCCCSKSIGDRIPFLTCLRCGLGPVAQIVGDSLRDSRVSVGLHEQTRRYSLSSGHRRTSPSNRQHWYQGGGRRRVVCQKAGAFDAKAMAQSSLGYGVRLRQTGGRTADQGRNTEPLYSTWNAANSTRWVRLFTGRGNSALGRFVQQSPHEGEKNWRYVAS